MYVSWSWHLPCNGNQAQETSCMQKDFLSSLHLLLSYICSMVYSKRYILILRSPLVAEKLIVEVISFTCSIPQTIQTTVSPCSCLVVNLWEAILGLEKEVSFMYMCTHSVICWTHNADVLQSLPSLNGLIAALYRIHLILLMDESSFTDQWTSFH